MNKGYKESQLVELSNFPIEIIWSDKRNSNVILEDYFLIRDYLVLYYLKYYK